MFVNHLTFLYLNSGLKTIRFSSFLFVWMSKKCGIQNLSFSVTSSLSYFLE